MKKIGIIGHLDHGKTSLTAALVRVMAAGIPVRDNSLLFKPSPMPDDLVVARNRDADEAGDYRVMKHSDAVGDPQWEITNINPKDLD